MSKAGGVGKWLVFALAAVLVFSLLTPAQVVRKSQGGLSDLQTSSPRLWVGQNITQVNDLRADTLKVGQDTALNVLSGEWDRFLSENGNAWNMAVDVRAGRASLVSGQGIPWIPGKGNSLIASALGDRLASGPATRVAILRLSADMMRRYPELFGTNPSEFVVNQEGTGEFGGYLWYVNLDRQYHGIPVENSYVVFRVNNGNLIQFGGEFLGPINVDPIPSFSQETARQILDGYVGGLNADDELVNQGSLSIVPLAPQGDVGVYNGSLGQGVDFHLVYTVAFRRPSVMGTWVGKIDAHTGEVLSFSDVNEYGSIKGGIYVTSNLDTERVVPFPYANSASGTYADAAGVYSQTSGTVTSTMAGKYVKITDSCGSISLSATAPADMSFGTSSGTDCTTPGVGGAGNTHAARSNYYHLTIWKEKAMAWLPSNTWLQGQVTSKVNLNQTCNAYWDGSAVNFFKSGGGCSNTGELPTVFLHEIGHGLDSNDGSPTSKVGSSESYGDTNGVLMTHNSCLGVNFIPGQNCSGYGNACTSCTGIRDVDYAKHSSQTPAKPSMLSASSGFHCSTSSSYPGPCGYEGHCESYIMSEALWTLAANSTYGLMSKSGMDSNTAWFIADRLFFLTRPTSGDSYTCASLSTANGCGTSNWFMTYLAADDDNGNLSDGTPHGAEIYKAFNLHGVACSTYSSIADSTTCAISQTAPTLTATPGAGNIALSWPAVTGATGYAVLRNELGATAGMMILAKTTSTSYTDSVVATGVTYYYSVVGYTGTINTSGGGGSCLGKLSSVVSATPGTGTTYSISGTVSGATASGVTMSLTGASTASTTTDTSGNYTFSGLANGSYTVTPSKSGYTFSPTSTAVTISGANQTGKNFTATAAATYSISGTVSGAIASGVTMSLTGAATASTTTATDGTYTFSGLANGSYTVTPSKSGYTFSPTSTAVTISGANQTGKNFTSTASTTYSISGTVSGATASGVTMSLTGASTASTTTDTSGNYTFSGLANGSYTVTPSKSGYTFSPTSIAVTISSANQTGKNFTATAVGGDIALTSGVGVAGTVAKSAYNYYTIAVPSGATALSITLTGLSADIDLYVNNSTTHPTTSSYYGRSYNGGTTNESLSYTNPTVATWSIAAYGYAAGNYTVTATVTTGTTTYSISGTVSGATASGVTMSLTGASTASTTTDTSGNYTFSGLANGSYTVTPSKSGYTFSPTSIAVTVSGANQTGKNFTSTASGGDIVLTSGVGVSTGSMTLQTWKYYTIAVPSGATNLAITLTGLSADLDLYVNNSTTHPTTSSYYGASTNSSTTNESLSYATPTVATWSIGVYAYAAGSCTVTATVTTGGGGTTTILTNGFESSTGWAQADTSGTAGTWSLVTSGTYPTCSVHAGSYMAKFNSYDAASGSATRYYRSSGVAVGSTFTAVTFTFWMYHDTGYSSSADKIQPQVSTNGTTWTNIGSAINRYDGSTGWKQVTIDLTAYKGQTVYLGFLATSAYGNNMFIDDVLLTGTGTGLSGPISRSPKGELFDRKF